MRVYVCRGREGGRDGDGDQRWMLFDGQAGLLEVTWWTGTELLGARKGSEEEERCLLFSFLLHWSFFLLPLSPSFFFAGFGF